MYIFLPVILFERSHLIHIDPTLYRRCNAIAWDFMYYKHTLGAMEGLVTAEATFKFLLSVD